MSSITQFALGNTRIAILAILGIVIVGLVSYLNFPSQEDPTITIRQAQVITSFPGMSAQRVESLLTRKIEEVIREIPEVKILTSVSKPGVSIITVDIHDRYFDLNPIWQALRNKTNDIKASLPQGTQGPNVNDDFGNVAVATIMLTADGFSLRERRDTARWVRDRLYAVAGVKKVLVSGLPSEIIYLEANNARLAQYGLSPQELIQTLQRQNIILPGGKLNSRGTELIIEPSGNFESLGDIRQVVLTLPQSGQVAYLRDIVKVNRTVVQPPDRLAYFNGEPAIVIGVSMLDGINIVKFGKDLRARITTLENSLAIGYALRPATFQPSRVEASINDFTGNLYQTIAIVLVVVMLFMGLRTGLIVGAIVPMTMLLAIIVMGLVDVQLHRISIASLIIALGMLVDNGIVVSEDIKRRFDLGEDRRQACIDAGRTLAIPLLTSSLTTILAFSPLLLAENVTGEFLFSLSLVLLITLLGSWFLAMFATPLLCLFFLKAGKAKPEKPTQRDSGFYRRYNAILAGVIRLRWVFLAGVGAAFAGAIVLFGLVPVQFMPDSDRNQIQITVTLPVGASSKETDKVVRRLTAWLASKANSSWVAGSAAYVGFGGPRFFLALAPIDPDPNSAYVLVNTKEPKRLKADMERVNRYALGNLPEARAAVKPLFLGAKEPNIIQYRIVGPNGEQLRAAGDALIAAMRKLGNMPILQQDWDNKIISVLIEIDQARARRAGVSSEEIARALNSFFSGERVTDYREGDTVIPVMLRGEYAQRNTLSRLITVNVYSATRNTNIPLIQIADLKPRWQEGRIRRRNLERTLTVSAKHATLTATALHAQILPALDRVRASLAPGYRIELGGELESAGEANSAILDNMPIPLFAIFILLVWQFNSFRRTAIIGITIPLSIIGAVVGLLVMDAKMSFTTLLGLLSLAGIIINNAIVLIDQIDQERADGALPYDAVIAACVKRLRPILISSLTTILGLLPLMLFGGELWYGMTVAIMFGLALGTILTLAVVPVLFTLFFGIRPPNAKGEPGPITRFLANFHSPARPTSGAGLSAPMPL